MASQKSLDGLLPSGFWLSAMISRRCSEVVLIWALQTREVQECLFHFIYEYINALVDKSRVLWAIICLHQYLHGGFSIPLLLHAIILLHCQEIHMHTLHIVISLSSIRAPSLSCLTQLFSS